VTLDLAKLASKTVRIDEAPRQGRTARGRKIIDLKTGDRVTGLIIPREFPRPLSKPPARKSTTRRKK
jgi:hypothetical protein